MHPIRCVILSMALGFSATAGAADYALSADGLAVVRLVPQATVAASTFDTSLLPVGYTASTAAGGSLAVTKFDAGYRVGNGGGEIEALYKRGAALAAGQKLEWIQVGTDNVPLPGYPSPYLDSSAASKPFYMFTTENRDSALPANQLNFYDYSTRAPASLATTNPITWNANLYPVTVDDSKNVQVFDGVSWGWTMKKAPVGTTSALFTNSQPGSATVTGVGTSSFSWGIGDPSALGFAGTAFDTTPGTKFKIGTLAFHNGVIRSGSGAASVDFEVPINFTNIPELNFSFKTKFTLINTLNVDGDPIASADSVSIGSFGYTFNVLEGATATVDVMATLTAPLSGTPGTVGINGALFDPTPFDVSPTYSILITGLQNASAGGFISQIPEPAAPVMMVLGLGVIGLLGRRRG